MGTLEVFLVKIHIAVLNFQIPRSRKENPFEESPTSSLVLAIISYFSSPHHTILVLRHTEFEPETFMYIRADSDQEPLT